MKKLLGSSLVILWLSSLFGYTFAASDCKEVEFEDGTVCVSIEKISDTRFKLEIDDDGVDGPIRCNVALPGYNNNSNAGFLAWSTWSDCDQTFTYDYNKYKNDEATVKVYVRSNEEYPEDREDKPSSNSQRTFPQWEYSFDDGERTDSDNYDDDDDNDNDNNNGDLDSFNISLSDSTPDTDDEVTLTIKAYDDDDDTMTDYDGSDAEVSVEYKTSSSSSWKDATSTQYSIDDKTPKFSNGKATTDIEFKKDYAYRITVTDDDEDVDSNKIFYAWDYDSDDEDDDDDNDNDNEDVDNFYLTTNDATPDTDDEVDLTIKARDNDNDTVTDYDGDVEFKVYYRTSSSSSWKLTTSSSYFKIDSDYDDGYSFKSSYKGVKTLSDFITFKKDYDFKVRVEDEDDSKVYGEKIFEVGGSSSSSNNEDVDNFYLTTNDATPDTDDEVDLTIKARDNDNDTVTDYDGDVEFKVYYRTSSSSSWKLTTSSSYFKIDSDYDDGYSFKSSYKGVKTLSDFITFKKDYDFKVRVEDEDDSKVYGEKIFEVGGSSSSSSSKVDGFTSKELDTVEELYDEREDMIDDLKDKYSALRNSSKRKDMSDDMYDNMKDVIDDEDDREFEDYDDFNDAVGDRYSYTDRIK